MIKKCIYIFIILNIVLSISISYADDSFEVKFFPFRNYTLQSILMEKEILQEDFDKYRIILTEISRAQSDGKIIDFNLINSICIENNLTYKRFYFIFCKLPICIFKPYRDYVYKNLVFSCTKNEILLSHTNKDVLLLKSSITERLRQVK
ncbi:MAG: hypothetical protein LBS60_10300 [Deltaproteobacteria bacterium]|jgi:hypothetical protein|nr:hypothetical protein [Deltaproteobacteria bacterium]